MRKLYLHQRIVVFFAGVLLLSSCEVVNEPTPAPAVAKVVQVAKEDRGFNLLLDNAVAQTTAKISFKFRVKRSFASELLGNYADSLACDNFTLLEDDELISKFESAFSVQPAFDQYKMHALLLLDLSGSVAPKSLDSLKSAATNFVRQLFGARGNFQKKPLQIALSIYYFDGRENIFPLIDFTADPAQLLAEIAKIRADLAKDNSTNLFGAVIQGINIIKTRAVQKGGLISAGSLVIFTDGTDRAQRRTKADAISAVEGTDSFVSTYTIGLGNEIDKATLIRLAKDGYVFANAVDKLVPSFESIANRILVEARSPYLIEYCSPSRAGNHRLLIRAHTIDQLYFGSITVSFNADDFEGGCTLANSCEIK